MGFKYTSDTFQISASVQETAANTLTTATINLNLDSLSREILEPIINNLIKRNDANFKGVGQPLRIALTGSKFGPGIYDIITSLGKDEVTKRLNNKIFT